VQTALHSYMREISVDVTQYVFGVYMTLMRDDPHFPIVTHARLMRNKLLLEVTFISVSKSAE